MTRAARKYNPRAVFQRVQMSHKVWIRAIADYIREEVGPRDDRVAKGMRRRAEAMTLCVTHVEGHVCEHCGAPRPASGRLNGAGKPCNARACPRCARRNSMKAGAHGRSMVRRLPEVDRYRWRLLTITSRYDPTDPAEVTREALQGRLAKMRKAWSAAWRKLKAPGAGAFVSWEMGVHGMVHCHALYYGPFVVRKVVAPAVKAAYPAAALGKTIEVTDPRRAVCEVMKYSVKSPGPRAESWMAGHQRQLPHPQLIARWEVATYGAQLTGRYGALRKLEREPEEPRELGTAPETELCINPDCACRADTGPAPRWVREKWDVGAWVMLCHQWGAFAFGARQEKPPPLGGDYRGSRHHEPGQRQDGTIEY